MVAIHAGCDVLFLEVGDRVRVLSHEFEITKSRTLVRRAGVYEIEHIFQNGNLWAKHVNRDDQPIVIRPDFVIERVR